MGAEIGTDEEEGGEEERIKEWFGSGDEEVVLTKDFPPKDPCVIS